MITSIPFDLVGSYVVLTVRINTSTPLRFILDSGLSNTLITEMYPSDSLSLQFSDTLTIKGLEIGRAHV